MIYNNKLRHRVGHIFYCKIVKNIGRNVQINYEHDVFFLNFLKAFLKFQWSIEIQKIIEKNHLHDNIFIQTVRLP